MAYERMSAQDAALFCAQDPATPLQIGAVARFDGSDLLRGGAGLDLARLRAHVEGRLEPLPRFRQILRPVAFDQGPPVWVDDPDFDIVHHVMADVLAGAGVRCGAASLRGAPARGAAGRPPAAVGAVVRPRAARRPGRQRSTGNDVMARPEGQPRHGRRHRPARVRLARSSTGAAAAGPSGTAPGATARSTPARARRPDPAARPALARDRVLARGRHDVAVLARGVAAVLHPARWSARPPRWPEGWPPRWSPAPDLAITRPVGTRRDFAWLRLPLADLRKVGGHDFGVTLNDVVLSIVSAGLARSWPPQPRRASRPRQGRGARVLVPVSTHAARRSRATWGTTSP